MFPKKHRVGALLATHVSKSGATIYSQHVTARYICHDGDGKFTVVVSKKIAPKAVVRNNIKRRIREALKSVTHTLSGVTLVIYVKRCVVNISFKELRQELTGVVREIELIEG